MKRMVSQSLTAVALVLGTTLPFSAAYAQTVSDNVASAARQACIESARSKGFEVADVVSITPKGTDGANVVLNLTRDGQPYKLTCGYSKETGAVVGDNATAGTTVTAPDWSRLWWLLLPLLGLPLLLAWARTRDGANPIYSTAAGRSEAIVRQVGSSVNVHSGPGDDYRVTGRLREGQRLWLTGRYNNSWAELEDGGWVPASYLEIAPSYARR
jgi:hypothetical protein